MSAVRTDAFPSHRTVYAVVRPTGVVERHQCRLTAEMRAETFGLDPKIGVTILREEIRQIGNAVVRANLCVAP